MSYTTKGCIPSKSKAHRYANLVVYTYSSSRLTKISAGFGLLLLSAGICWRYLAKSVYTISNRIG